MKKLIATKETKTTETVINSEALNNMGAIAFGLLGGKLGCSISKRDGGEELYKVTIKAVNSDRSEKYSTIKEFLSAWETASKQGL